ncbi:MAG: ABC transporter permease [Gammaproteobacteria bacterium]|nr:ABC transporter permease [Gammaproteobacteria bacterium]
MFQFKKISFNFPRIFAMLIKEFIQLRRDKATFGMMIGIPIIQLLLFGYAINMNPKNLPTAINAQDNSVFTRTFLEGVKNSGYFQFTHIVKNEAEANNLLQEGRVSFVINIPENFSKQLVRGQQPKILVETDGTDPSATGSAIQAITDLIPQVFNRNLIGPLSSLLQNPSPVNLQLHALYNPSEITQYNIVPGLMGVVLTMTMVIITSMAITREREKGTMESLLATPLKPIEVILGKLLPYVLIGYIQATIIMLASRFLFDVPILGNVMTLMIVLLPFIVANLSVGLAFSTLAKNQLQAVQAGFFFFLPSLLLSGFMFPFRGMPIWAQWIGSIFPLTHFLTIVRGIMLKGNGWFEIWPALWPILIFMTIALSIAILRYQQTLD